MANSPSARKRIRQTIKRTERNVARRSRARGYVRVFEEALYATDSKGGTDSAGKKASDKKVADKKVDDNISPKTLEEHFRTAISELSRAAQRGALHRKAVSRKVSRLARRLVRHSDGTLEPKIEGKASGKGSGRAKAIQKAKRIRASAKAKSK